MKSLTKKYNLWYWNNLHLHKTSHSVDNLAEKFNFEVFNNVLAVLRNFILKQQHEESTSHVTQQVPAAIAVHLTEAVYCTLLHITNTETTERNEKRCYGTTELDKIYNKLQ